jgi:hypothetical protein
MTYQQMAYDNGIYYVLQVTPIYNKRAKAYDYKCLGYARGAQIDLAEWVYWAIDETEAYEQKTKDYLIRELKPLVKAQLKHLEFLINRHKESN